MTTDELLALNPFPGLRAFTPGESDRFFGRQQQIDELVALLSEARLVGVAGASGCGKSSLVLAGLTGELARLNAAGDDIEWRPVVMRPGNHSIANLAQALSGALGMQGDEARTDALYGRLSLGALGLVEAIRAARLEPNVRVLVIVDQFEEIFRFRQAEPEEPSAFVKLLLTAVQDAETPLGVVLTLRSSELGKCADFPDLAEAVSRGQYLVPKLARDQRKEAIVKPIEGAGFRIAPRLVQRILNDVSDDFDDLPVMQHVLSRTWQRWALTSEGKRPIDVEDYEAVGTAARALSNHADEAYDSLPGLGPLVEQVFRALTERVDGGIENRRPLEFNRLCAVTGGDPADVARVIERFRRADTAFLMPPPAVPLATNPVIDISHESLIRQWQRLRDWAKSESDSRSALIRVLQSARRHENDEGDLARGRDLERMLAWRQSVALTPAWVELYAREDGATGSALVHKFLTLSAAAAAREKRRQRIRLWSWRAVAIGVVVASLSITLAGIGLQKRAKSGELAGLALLGMNHNAARGARIALAAFERDPSNRRAEYALRTALAGFELAHTEKIIEFPEDIEDARYTRDGSRLVVYGQNKKRIYDARSLEQIGRELNAKDYLLEGNWLASATEDGALRVESPDRATASETLSCGADDRMSQLAIGEDERHIAVGCASGKIIVWHMGARETRRIGVSIGGAARGAVTDLAFSADNGYLVSAHDDGRVFVWKGDLSAPWVDLGAIEPNQPGKAPITATSIEFDPKDPGRIAAQLSNRTAIVWTLDLTRRVAKETKRLEHERPIGGVFFVPAANGGSALLTVSDKRVLIWSLPELKSRTFRPHQDNILHADVSADGRYLATASSDGNAGLSSTVTGERIALLDGHRDTATHAFFAPAAGNTDGSLRIVTASKDRTLRVWRAQPPQLVASGTDLDWKLSAAFDPKGERVAFCGYPQAGVHCGVVDTAPGAEGTLPRPRDLEAVAARSVRAVSWSADGASIIATASGGPPLIVWDAASGKSRTPAWLAKWQFAEFAAARPGLPTGGDSSKPGRKPELLTVGDRGKRLALWSADKLGIENAVPDRELGGVEGLVRARLSPDGRWIAAFGGTGIALFDLNDPAPKPRKLEYADGRAHDGTINDVRFSPDSTRLASASADRRARIWRLEPKAGEPAAISLEGHASYVMSASFSLDSRHVVTGSADKTVGVWAAGSGAQLASLKWHEDEINQVQFDPSGRRILTASDDGTVKIGRCEACTLPPGEMKRRVEKYAPLTEAEQRSVDRETAEPWYFKLPAFLSR